ncbi:MAG: hypothetical protein B6D41_15715 [Chloroflexi bacterium UTCFX4]|nr:MAG: hypothetical protein B6D41_15715 [Chloroflexi bacterium UTCFX4]
MRTTTTVSEPWNWRARAAAVIERPMALFVALFAIFLLVYGASIFLIPKRYGRLIVGDGIYYFVYLRSATLDGDLNFQNDYEIYQSFNTEDSIKKREMLERKTPIGMPANLFSVGPAILWAPLFVLTHWVALVLGRAGDGYAFAYQAPIMFLSITYGFIGIVLIYRVTASLFSKFAAFVALLGVWLATNVVYYMGVSPSASHVLSLFASALFVYLWWRGRVRRTKWGWFMWGLSAGLMTLVRWQDVLIALLALLEWGKQFADDARAPMPKRLGAALATGVLFVAGMTLAFAPQMFAWQILYGSPLTAPQGGGFFQWLRPEILNVWFSSKRGLFAWSPLLFLATLGFAPLYLKHRLLGVAAIAIFLAESYVNSIVNDWWGGEAFGARRFISLMPFFALGLAALIDAVTHSVKRRAYLTQTAVLSVLVAFIVWNNLFILQYNLWLKGIGHISAMPTLQEMTLDKFTAPFLLLDKLRK